MKAGSLWLHGSRQRKGSRHFLGLKVQSNSRLGAQLLLQRLICPQPVAQHREGRLLHWAFRRRQPPGGEVAHGAVAPRVAGAAHALAVEAETMQTAVVGAASKLHSAIATCVSLLALATGGDGVAQPMRSAFGFAGASGDGATFAAPTVLAFAMTFQTGSMVGTCGIGAQQFHRAFWSTPSSIADAGARHLAAAVAVATALHRAVHAAEAGEAETPALDAAALTATGVGAEGLAAWAAVAGITSTLPSWTANTSIVAVVGALLSRQFVQAGSLLKAVQARSWQAGTTALQLHHHRAASMYHLRAIGALEA